ncbi:MAG: outer membrane protein assembly factor BamA [Planctomycetota bacterium]|nr:outer membrane protein assembly factor BamA [Planctomycetota bacterium]
MLLETDPPRFSCCLPLLLALTLVLGASFQEEPVVSPVRMEDADISVHGNESFWTRTIESFLAAYDTEEISPGLLDDISLDLVSFYSEDGFPFASVRVKVRDRRGKTRVSIYIQEGPRVRVQKIKFTGLSSVPEEELRDAISTKIHSFFKGAYFDRDQVRADSLAIAASIRRQGHLDVKVSEAIHFIDDRTGVIITFRIEEGKRIGVREIRFIGEDAIPRDRLLRAIAFSANAAFSRAGTETWRRRVLDLYADRGYAYAEVVADPADVDLERGEAVLTFRIKEGARQRVGDIRFVGQDTTTDALLSHQLVFGEGDWYSRKAVRSTVDRLYRLGIFEFVRTEVAPRREGEVTVTFRVKERKPGSARLGLGYGSFERLRGTVIVSYKNLFGWAKRAEAEARASGAGYRVALRYIDPSVFQTRWKSIAEVFYEDRENPNFDVLRYGGNLAFRHLLVEKVHLAVRGRLEKSEVSNLATGLLSADESIDLRSLAFILSRDARDSPVNPSRGTLLKVGLESAGGLLGGGADFDKLTAGATAYATLLPEQFILALSVRGGWIYPHDKVEGVPVQEQFYTGGEGTVRGFQEKEILPLDSFGLPTGTGGNSLLVANAELRFRIWKAIWGAIFWDAGNVWEDADGIDLADLRHSPGVGLRLVTPIGPIRLDWAHKIDRQDGEDPWEIHFSVGFAF